MIDVLEKLDNFIQHIKSHRDIKIYRFIKIAKDEADIEDEFESIVNEFDIYDLVNAVANIIIAFTTSSNISYINENFILEDSMIHIRLDDGTDIQYYSNIKHSKFIVKDECYVYEVSANLVMTKTIEKKWNKIKNNIIKILYNILVDMTYYIE